MLGLTVNPAEYRILFLFIRMPFAAQFIEIAAHDLKNVLHQPVLFPFGVVRPPQRGHSRTSAFHSEARMSECTAYEI